MAEEINNSMDIIDSRDVIARIDELESEIESAEEDGEEPDDEMVEELEVLKALADKAGDSPDWPYGEALIRDSYFEDYAQELAEVIGAIDRGASWPNNCIDWEWAARELQHDYIAVDFDGVTYWIRG